MDSLNSLLDFTKICRLCLGQEPPLSAIFSEIDTEDVSLLSLKSKIMACVAIEVNPGDNLPDKICNRCIEQLENWLKFKELCDNANTLLIHCAAGMQSLPDEILQNDLRENDSEHLGLQETSSDFCFVDDSLLEQDSLFKKIDESLEITESTVSKSISELFNENVGNYCKTSMNEMGIREDLEREANKELNKSKWREKYNKIYRRKYDCDICSKVFSKFNSLIEHDRVDHKDIIPEEMCLKCGQLFISNHRLNFHDFMKHKEKTYECDVCGVKSVSEKSLKIHKRRHSKRFACNVCSVVSSSERDLQDHMSVHSTDYLYSCETCLRNFKQRQSLQHHLKSHNPKLEHDFKCHICSQKFKNITYLKIHKASHNVENTAICEICGAILKNKTTLYIHKLTHKQKQHTCMDCNKMFSTKNLLKRHMLVHGEHKFTCTVCNKSYKRADTLSLHAETHSVSKLHYCDHCGQSFALNKYLKRHVARIHTKEN